MSHLSDNTRFVVSREINFNAINQLINLRLSGTELDNSSYYMAMGMNLLCILVKRIANYLKIDKVMYALYI